MSAGRSLALAALAAAAALLLAAGVAPSLAAPGPRATIYLSPTGDDGASGTDASRPVQTLARAQEILKAMRPAPDAAEIRIGDGRYVGQSVVWSWTPPGARIDIRAADPARRPVFDGVDNSTNWFELQGGAGRPTGVAIEGLEIRNYLSAVWLHGDRVRQDDRWTGGNVVRGNRFVSIGAKDPSGATYSAFAVELVNSRANLIEGNEFVDIVSTKHCTDLHAIYVAHGSSKNIIRDNLFDGGCGDAISLRDNSNDNLIERNTFRRQQARAIVLEWYCSRTVQSNCTKPGLECPSWDNRLADNLIEAGGARPPQLSYVAVPETQPGCADRGAAAPRVLVSADNRVR